jgi:hypothetical protein
MDQILMTDGRTRRSSFPARALRLVLASCVVLAAGVVLSAAPVLAASGEPPTISGESPAGVTEHGATLEAQIDPEGSETTLEVWIQCERPASGGAPCEPAAVSPLGQDHLASGSAAETVAAVLTGLEPAYSYTYWFVATNVAGRTEGRHRPLETQALGACNGGCPYKAELPEWVQIMSEEESAMRVREYEVRHANELEALHVKEAEQQTAREATEAREAAALKRQKEEEAAMTGGVSLAGTNVSVQRNGMALVKLECLGIESCHGKLTLTAKGVAKANAKGKKRPTRTVAIGTVGFSIGGDETKTIDLKLNTMGRALLKADHGRCGASLAILELAPSPANTETKTVQLIQLKSHGKTRK